MSFSHIPLRAWGLLLGGVLLWLDGASASSQMRQLTLIEWWGVWLCSVGLLAYTLLPMGRRAEADWRRRRLSTDLLALLALVLTLVATLAYALLGARESAQFFLHVALLIGALSEMRIQFETQVRRRLVATQGRLTALLPQRVRVSSQGREQSLAVEQLQVGSAVRVAQGEHFPADGVVLAGSTWVDECRLTGLAHEVEKGLGDTVLAGSCNLGNEVMMRVIRTGGETHLAGIIGAVDAAREAPFQSAAIVGVRRWLELLLPWTILVSILALQVWVLAGADAQVVLTVALALVLIICPCSLGLVPRLGAMATVVQGAEQGILFGRGRAFKVLPKVRTVVMEKRNALTLGRPQVVSITPAAHWNGDFLLQWAASLEALSSHALASAILQAAEARGLELIGVSQFETLPGKGVRGEISGSRVCCGNAFLMRDEGIELDDYLPQADALAAQGQTVMFVGVDGALAGMIGTTDPLHPQARSAVKRLKSMGLRVIMVSADDTAVAEAVARETGVDEVVARCLPAEKAKLIERLQHTRGTVAMVGRAEVDAAALHQADCSVAVSFRQLPPPGTHDLILLHGSLRGLVDALTLVRFARGNLRRTRWLAVLYHGVSVPLAAGGLYLLGAGLMHPVLASALALGLFATLVRQVIQPRGLGTDAQP